MRKMTVRRRPADYLRHSIAAVVAAPEVVVADDDDELAEAGQSKASGPPSRRHRPLKWNPRLCYFPLDWLQQTSRGYSASPGDFWCSQQRTGASPLWTSFLIERPEECVAWGLQIRYLPGKSVNITLNEHIYATIVETHPGYHAENHYLLLAKVMGQFAIIRCIREVVVPQRKSVMLSAILIQFQDSCIIGKFNLDGLSHSDLILVLMPNCQNILYMFFISW